MNNSEKMESKKTIHPISDESINCFFQNDDVLMLSDDSIDAVFNSIYNNFLDEAVYPHLTEVSKNQTKN
jgi:hypothetical protein